MKNRNNSKNRIWNEKIKSGGIKIIPPKKDSKAKSK